MPASLSVFLNVHDINKSIEFYERLGFTVDNRHKDKDSGKTNYADLSLDGAELGLGSIQANDDPEFRQWVGTPLGAGVLIYVAVENVDALYRQAEAARVTIEAPLTERPYGRLFTTNDPDGYSVSFIQEKK